LGGRWHVVEVLDRWGPGLMFEARDESDPDEPVLLKMLPAPGGEQALAKALARIVSAAQALAAEPLVQGAVIARDQGEEEGVLWLVTDELDAESLARVVAQAGGLDSRRAARLMLHVCDTLEGAHRRGLAHGGVTAEAVIVTSVGANFERAWVGDFGLAGRLSSPAHRAPEARRDAEKAEPRTDVWAVGRLLSQCVEDPDDSDVAPLIRWCMNRERTNRPRDIRVVRRELDRIVTGRSDTPWDVVVRAGRRAPRTAIWAAIAGVLGVVVALGAASLLTGVPADKDVSRGQAALSAGDTSGAILAFESALRRTSGRADALLGLARAREALNMPLAAEDAWRRLLVASPESVAGHLGLGGRLLADDKPVAAVEQAAAAAALAPALAPAHALHGRALLASGRAPDAAQAYERAAALAPSDAAIHHQLGTLLATVPDRRTRAEEALRTAAHLAPGVGTYRTDLAEFLARMESAGH
jgi:tetratricopeptide (TPR) repeat protein